MSSFLAASSLMMRRLAHSRVATGVVHLSLVAEAHGSNPAVPGYYYGCVLTVRTPRAVKEHDDDKDKDTRRRVLHGGRKRTTFVVCLRQSPKLPNSKMARKLYAHQQSSLPRPGQPCESWPPEISPSSRNVYLRNLNHESLQWILLPIS